MLRDYKGDLYPIPGTKAVALGWCVVHGDGELYRPIDPTESPTTRWDGARDVVWCLSVKLPFAGPDGETPLMIRYLVAPSARARLRWLMTTDMAPGGPYATPGPGIEADSGPVRCWIMQAGTLNVLTDGGVEQAIQAVQRVDQAMIALEVQSASGD